MHHVIGAGGFAVASEAAQLPELGGTVAAMTQSNTCLYEI